MEGKVRIEVSDPQDAVFLLIERIQRQWNPEDRRLRIAQHSQRHPGYSSHKVFHASVEVDHLY